MKKVIKVLNSGKFTAEDIEKAIIADSSDYRPRLFSQFIGSRRDISKWVDETNCIDFLYDLYELSFMFGACYMFETLCKDE